MSSIHPTKTTRDGKPARDTRWKARYRDPNGRSRAQTFDRKLDAQAFLDGLAADRHRGEFADPAMRRSRFDEWAERWWSNNEHRFTESTRKSTRRVLDGAVLPEFGGWRIGEIERADVKEWTARMIHDGAAPKSVRNRVWVLKAVLDEAIDSRALRDNPAKGLRVPKARASEPHFLTADQVETLARVIAEPYGFMVRFGAYSGLRPAEVAGLRVRRLDLLAGRIDVVETLTVVSGRLVTGPTKTRARRTVPLPPSLVAEAAEYLAWLQDRYGEPLTPEDYVFRSPEGAPLNTDNWRRRVMVPALERAGLPTAVRFYDLRHSCASMMIALGAHPRLVMERLGHSDIATTMNVYGHVWPTLHESITEQLDELQVAARAKPSTPPEATVTRLPKRASA